MPPRKVQGHSEALASALRAAGLEKVDNAARRLAVEYALQLDSGQAELAKVGRHYLDCLKALGLTPEARKAVTGGEVVNAGVSPLEKLRVARRVA